MKTFYFYQKEAREKVKHDFVAGTLATVSMLNDLADKIEELEEYRKSHAAKISELEKRIEALENEALPPNVTRGKTTDGTAGGNDKYYTDRELLDFANKKYGGCAAD